MITLSHEGTNYVVVSQTPAKIFKLISEAQDMSASDASLYSLHGDLTGVDELLADVELAPGKSAHVPADMSGDLALLIQFEDEGRDRDGEVWMQPKPIACLIDLGWIVAVRDGRTLDAAQYLARDFDSDARHGSMVFLAVTKAGEVVLEQLAAQAPEEDALAAFERYVLGDDPNRGEAA